MRDDQAMLLLRHTVSLFGKRRAGAPRCWDDHLDKFSASLCRPVCRTLPLSSLFSCSFSGKRHFISKWCQSCTLTHVVRTPGLLSVPTCPAVRSIINSGAYSRCCTPGPWTSSRNSSQHIFLCDFLESVSILVAQKVTSVRALGVS